ncbi:hypothetical protein KBY77_11645 [Synechococcus sp. Cruz-7E5]|nr:hypothetical protein [Synechococcus sp. Edmonson 11F2]MCP9863779.1 hypothetical protein [Synechococcus sp. Cruz-7E5]
MSNFHIDHVLPESLADDPAELEATLSKLGLGNDFDLRGWENLLPCRPGANLQKSAVVFDPAHIHYFLGVAAAKKPDVGANLQLIERRRNRGRAILLLQQCLERGELSAGEVSDILQQYEEAPEAIFELLEGMRFADAEEIRLVARADLESLRDRPIRFGENTKIEGVTLTNDANEERLVRTCREYDEAVAAGFYALTTFAMKMSSSLEHQCGLLNALQHASTPSASYISKPRASILDLSLVPYSFFPQIGELDPDEDLSGSYQDKVDEGSLVIRRVSHNLLQIVRPGGMGQQLVEVARADFNGDGLEDILLFEYCFATEGTLGCGSVRIITRTSSTGMLETISSPVSPGVAWRHDA